MCPSLIIGFGFGASFVALFAQLGGGIFTKAADVGADLVGKVEANIPEDDPRNPAVIADLVGDNVGDCAGRGADLFESTAAENIGAMILGVSLATATHNPNWILFPLIVRAFGLIASTIGLLYVRPSVVVEPDKAAGRDPGEIAMKQLIIGYMITCGLSIIGVFLGSFLLLNGNNVTGTNGIPPWVWFGLAGTVGILLSIAFVYITQYYTSGTYRPVLDIVASQPQRTGDDDYHWDRRWHGMCRHCPYWRSVQHLGSHFSLAARSIFLSLPLRRVLPMWVAFSEPPSRRWEC